MRSGEVRQGEVTRSTPHLAVLYATADFCHLTLPLLTFVPLQTFAGEHLRRLATGEVGASEGVQTAISAALDAPPSQARTIIISN